MIEALPEYLHLSRRERGGSVNLDPESYGHLARSALAIIRQTPAFMGIYNTPAGCCCLDIWLSHCCLTIVIDRQENELGLFFCCEDLDCPAPAMRLLSTTNSKAGWSQLRDTAKAQLSH